MRKFFVLVFFMFVFIYAQNETSVLKLSIDKSNININDDKINLTLNVELDPNWHVYANKINDEFLIPSSVFLKQAKLINAKYPKGKELELMGVKEFVYANKNSIDITFENVKNTIGSPLYIYYKYQACNNKMCLAPATDSIAFDIEEVTSQNIKKSGFIDKLGTENIFYILIILFFGGLALNLTPCVYPVIPLTISFFGSQAKGKKSQKIFLAFFYLLGIALSYSALGTIAALTGKIIGNALQNPIVLWSIVGLFVLLSLSMFGLYEIRPPYFLMSAGGGKRGVAGSFFMGMVVGIVAAPCVGPVTAGLLIHVAELKDPFLGFLYFFILSLGLGLPYFVLALFSVSIDKLPGSGEWMVWIKKFFGFVLILMAVYYTKSLIPKFLYDFIFSFVLLTAFFYLAFFSKVNTQRFRGFKYVKIIILVLILTFFIYSLIPLFIKNPAKPDTYGHQAYSLRTQQEYIKTQKPFIIDFRAEWCAPCRKFEKNVLADSAVIEKIESIGFMTVDLTDSSDESVLKVVKKFNVKGVPTIIFFNKNGIEVHRVSQYIDKSKFINKIESLKEGKSE